MTGNYATIKEKKMRMPGTDMERSPGYILKQKYGAEQYIQCANFCIRKGGGKKNKCLHQLEFTQGT